MVDGEATSLADARSDDNVYFIIAHATLLSTPLSVVPTALIEAIAATANNDESGYTAIAVAPRSFATTPWRMHFESPP